MTRKSGTATRSGRGQRNGPKTKTSPKTTAKVQPQTTSAPILTTEALNDGQLQVLFFQHKRKITELVATRQVARDEAKRITKLIGESYALAEAEGIAREEIELAMELTTDVGRQKMEQLRTRQERVAKWLGEPIGAQSDLVSNAHHEAGKRAALNDEIARPPAHLHVRDQQAWLEGHAEGVTMTNELRAGGFKALGDQPTTAAHH